LEVWCDHRDLFLNCLSSDLMLRVDDFGMICDHCGQVDCCESPPKEREELLWDFAFSVLQDLDELQLRHSFSCGGSDLSCSLLSRSCAWPMDLMFLSHFSWSRGRFELMSVGPLG
jgi:hypothetical protein